MNRTVRTRATDQEIKKWVLRRHGFVPDSAWIAQCKELSGVATPDAGNCDNPCPPEKQAAIKQALREFGLLASPDEPGS